MSLEHIAETQIGYKVCRLKDDRTIKKYGLDQGDEAYNYCLDIMERKGEDYYLDVITRPANLDEMKERIKAGFLKCGIPCDYDVKAKAQASADVLAMCQTALYKTNIRLEDLGSEMRVMFDKVTVNVVQDEQLKAYDEKGKQISDNKGKCGIVATIHVVAIN